MVPGPCGPASVPDHAGLALRRDPRRRRLNWARDWSPADPRRQSRGHVPGSRDRWSVRRVGANLLTLLPARPSGRGSPRVMISRRVLNIKPGTRRTMMATFSTCSAAPARSSLVHEQDRPHPAADRSRSRLITTAGVCDVSTRRGHAPTVRRLATPDKAEALWGRRMSGRRLCDPPCATGTWVDLAASSRGQRQPSPPLPLCLVGCFGFHPAIGGYGRIAAPTPGKDGVELPVSRFLNGVTPCLKVAGTLFRPRPRRRRPGGRGRERIERPGLGRLESVLRLRRSGRRSGLGCRSIGAATNVGSAAGSAPIRHAELPRP